MQTGPQISTQELVKVVNEHPGLSSYEIAEQLQLDPKGISSRLFAMCNARVPQIKKLRVEGLYCFYPFRYEIEVDPVGERPFQTISMNGQPLRIYKVAAEEMAQLERKRSRGKYADIVGALEELEVGSGLYIPAKGISFSGLTFSIRHLFKGSEKKFEFSNGELYITAVRKS